MNYIYDILLNFNDMLYDFYDWNVSDTILHIRRIPLILISSKTLNDIKENEIEFDIEFLEKIKNKTEYFVGRNIKILKNTCLFTDGMDVIALKIDENKCSSLIIEEELDILEDIRSKKQEIKYQIIKKRDSLGLKTRRQYEMEKMVLKKLKELKLENNNSKISYLYYECFNEKESNTDIILNKFYNSINKPDIILKLSDFFLLIN
jgi:hypothetical protein